MESASRICDGFAEIIKKETGLHVIIKKGEKFITLYVLEGLSMCFDENGSIGLYGKDKIFRTESFGEIMGEVMRLIRELGLKKK